MFGFVLGSFFYNRFGSDLDNNCVNFQNNAFARNQQKTMQGSSNFMVCGFLGQFHIENRFSSLFGLIVCSQNHIQKLEKCFTKVNPKNRCENRTGEKNESGLIHIEGW